jgi:hypothetical protein
MTKSKVLVLLVFVTGITFSVVETTASEAQPTTDNATMATQDNMTAGAGNTTDANVTQSGKISGCGNECF